MKKVQIFVDHDIIIRHFIQNHSFAELEKSFQVQYVFPHKHNRVKTDVTRFIQESGNVSIVWLPVNTARIAKLRYLAKIQTFYRSYFGKDYGMIRQTWKTFMGKREYAKVWLLSLRWIFPFYKKRFLASLPPCTELEQVIDAFKPDAILHPTVLEGLFISDLSALGKKKNIPFIALMNSWDNPSTKAMALDLPEWLVVWGEQSKNHAVQFLGMDPKQVKILGAAQFDVYRTPPEKSREEICASMEIDPNKKLILYAGSSKCVNEIKHLQELDQLIVEGKIPNAHVIFRPHPWRDPAPNEADFFDIPWKNVSMDPSMREFYSKPSAKEEVKVNLVSYNATHNILSAVDLVMSNMSTLMLEAALHGKPTLALMTETDLKDSTTLRLITQFYFFQEMLERLEIPSCREYRDLSRHCNALLEQGATEDFKTEKVRQVGYFVDLGKDSFPSQLRTFVQSLVRS